MKAYAEYQRDMEGRPGIVQVQNNEVATPAGFEPAISTVTGWHVRPLHHGAVEFFFTMKIRILIRCA